jgi:predicted nucleic acid-binding protein
VTDVVLDASVVLKWFRAEEERHDVPARSLRAAFEAGQLVCLRAAASAPYVAACVALAEGEGIRLVTDDDPIVSLAPGIAIALADHKG